VSNSGLPVQRISDEPPPLLKRWTRVYAAVLAYLVVLICVLFAATEYFHY
jgi:hypothetical protein